MGPDGTLVEYLDVCVMCGLSTLSCLLRLLPFSSVDLSLLHSVFASVFDFVSHLHIPHSTFDTPLVHFLIDILTMLNTALTDSPLIL